MKKLYSTKVNYGEKFDVRENATKKCSVVALENAFYDDLDEESDWHFKAAQASRFDW